MHHDDNSDGESDAEVAATGAAVESENEDSPIAHGVWLLLLLYNR